MESLKSRTKLVLYGPREFSSSNESPALDRFYQLVFVWKLVSFSARLKPLFLGLKID
jgi:hypothetical protein